MKRLITTIFAAFIFFQLTNAQVTLWDELAKASNNTLNQDTTTTNTDSFFIPEGLESNVDSLLNSWHVKYYTRRVANCGNAENTIINDSTYRNRLARLPRVMNMTYNDQVRSYINFYVDRRKTQVEYMLGLADFYFPMIEQTLDQYGLPIELKYLTIVESALNPTALSRAGASGLWQFMLPTGRIYGLEINSLVDERRDPVKSTHAACQYLKDMYEVFHDWDLVIAAYNCGPGNVQKAINRSGGKTNFWEIYEYLPRETRSYVPIFIAANYVMNYYHEHNICPVQTSMPVSTDTVVITKQLHFDQLAAVLRIDKEQLKALNPQFKREIIPGNSKPYPLILPTTFAYSFAGKEDSIYTYRFDEYFANKNTSTKNQEKITHKVKAGESIASIANKYGVTTAQVRKWNGLRKSKKVATGRRLTIYVDNGGYSLAANSQPESKSEEMKETASVQQAKSSSITSSDTSEGQNVSGEYKRYKVKRGDSFYTISQRYPGISAQELMEINNFKKGSTLKVGQIIKVPAV